MAGVWVVAAVATEEATGKGAKVAAEREAEEVRAAEEGCATATPRPRLSPSVLMVLE